MLQPGSATATQPAVTSSLGAAKAARTWAFSRFETFAKSHGRKCYFRGASVRICCGTATMGSWPMRSYSAIT